MSYEIYRLKKLDDGSFEQVEKIKHIESVNWSDNLEDVFISFDFTATVQIDVGTWIELYEKDDKKTVFYGIITKTSQTQQYLYTYSGYDTGFYLYKNKAVKQFRAAKVTDAINVLCTEFGLKTGSIIDISYKISKIYKNTAVSDIFAELLEFAIQKGLSNQYYFDCKNGKVNLFQYQLNDSLCGYVANIYRLKSTDTITSYDISSSIEEMKNKIKVISSVTKNKQTSVTERYTTSAENTEEYGILQEIIETDTETLSASCKMLAENKLKELNVITEEITLSVLGDYNMKKGIYFPIENTTLDLSGYYLIKHSSHSIQGSIEKVNINIKKTNL